MKFFQKLIFIKVNQEQNTFDITIYPNEKGPYNNNLSSDFLNNVRNNWSGITRKINSTNFKNQCRVHSILGIGQFF